MNDLEKIVFKYALLNAAKHKGSANPGAVIGSIMANEEELRSKAKEIGPLAGKIVAQVNALSAEEQASEMKKYGVEVEEKKPKAKEVGLQELPGTHENIVLRFAPNPSGPLHIGHSRAAVPNAEYVKRHNGKLILRIEDTDPKRVFEPAYEMIPEDLAWLGINPDEIIYQSDRFEIYYDYARQLIEKGAAYMCTCDGATFKELKDNCKPCPCRDNSVEENLALWEKFDTMQAGEAVLRVKTDINHKNPAIRDWVAMRLVDEEHPRMGTKYRIYPMMNFSVSVDDHLMGMTHVLRGKDHLANSEKQKYLYDHMEWDLPEFIHYGRLKMEDIALSTSKAMAGIEDGTYSGWDDPRLGTLRAIARRGIDPRTIYNLITEIGVKMADSAISWKKIYGLNRNFVEPIANRYFFCEEPVEVSVNGYEDGDVTIERPLHADHMDRGNRLLSFDGSAYIAKADYADGLFRLMDAVNVEIAGEDVNYHSTSFEEARDVKARIIQWVPTKENVNVKIVMDDASVKTGLGEIALNDLEVGDIVQFERVGFARLDEIKDDELVFYYAHK
ncbi:MAG: glutamate--tRNA ligase [Methanobrevibacter sp.]|uniref:glutamate--tRNA ligase n=1 Tax=Methanobrevibacter TaxID=2172 RepID=UPI0015BD05C8|nr:MULTISPECIES: glutamate--tRNA ligase [Methanobrevibacter]MBS7258533.1 glutamate--tRNA ligase [Methanobrevibacter sp.]MDY3097605.1 glutamate--tRNA ligase [Methanobrevibacter sp.]